MRRRTPFVTGITILLLANNVVTLPEWEQPYFAKPDPLDERVTWVTVEDNPSSVDISIWEGIIDKVMLTRLTYQDGGTSSDRPTLTYSGTVGLGLELVKDDDPNNPLYIHATEAGDYDTGTKFFLIALNSPYPVTGTRYMFIQLENVNDNAPIIQSPEKCSFDEERLYDEKESDCIFTVTDIDGGACYVSTSINDEHFELVPISTKSRECKTAMFALTVKETLDFERYRLHSLQIVIQDDGIIYMSDPNDDDDEDQEIITIHGGSQTQEITFVVNVNDIPDVGPVWEILTPYITVDEKTEDEKSKFEFRARDGDFDLDWGIEYTLVFSTEYEKFKKYFEINDNGILTIKYMDRDEYQTDIINVEIVATEIPDYDKYPGFVALDERNTIVIMVRDKNDHFPEISSTIEENLFKIEEETSFTSEKEFTVSDPDLGENGQFELSLEENFWSKNFKIIPPRGYQSSDITITSFDSSIMDYEDPDWRVISLTIIAQEVADKEHVRRETFTIELIDVIDENPEFDEDTCAEIYKIEENQPTGYLVVRAEATDRDEGDVVTHSLKNNYMTIDPKTGDVTTISDNAFDYERQPQIVLQIVATDSIGLRAVCELNIDLIDLNDEPPSLVLPYSTEVIDEHSEVGTLASETIEGTDPDEGASLIFEIDWSGSVAYKQGIAVRDKEKYERCVDLLKPTRNPTGEFVTNLYIADKQKFDWEVFDTLKLKIDVIDEDTHEDYLINRLRSATMTVTVGDINDCPPVFNEKSQDPIITVNENTDADTLIVALLATDDDGEGNNEITYSIEPMSPDQLVADSAKPRLIIDKDTGQIYTTVEKIDCDEWQTLVFKYEVTASDTKHIDTTTVTINIQDLNDNFPEVIDPEEPHLIKKSIEEHTPGSWPVGCIEGLDIDVSVDFHTITYFIEGISLIEFEMDECDPFTICCLYAKDGYNLDREIQPSHEITVYSRDNFKDKIKDNSREGPQITMILTLIDINDKPPVFESHKTFEVYENRELSGFKVEVTDEDEGVNAEFDCEEDPVITVLYPTEPVERDLTGVFEVRTEDDGCSVHSMKSLVGLWGKYTITLKANDRGTNPESLSGTGSYTLNVINVNLNEPEILFPEEGETIILDRDQIVNGTEPLKDYYGKYVEDFVAFDADDPSTENGQVYFELTGGENVFWLESSSTLNHAVLRMYRLPALGRRRFDMSVIAKDRAQIGPGSSEEVFFTVWVISTASFPEFVDIDPPIVEFYENKTENPQSEVLPAAVNLDQEPLPVKLPIYYFIIEGDTEMFSLDKTTRELTLMGELDYEEQTIHTLKVFATHSENLQDENMFETSVLDVTIQVLDVIDTAPQFSDKLFPGTFSADQKVGQTILQLQAYDPDVDDKLTFVLVRGTVKASDSSLEQFASDTAFLVDADTGIISLNFNPNGRVLSGYFEFRVQVYDLMDFTDEATVNVFVVSEIHRVEFNFYNPVSVVETKQKEIEEVFTRVLGYICVVEEVMIADTASVVDTTDVLTHFIDNSDKSPVLRKDIENQFLDERTYRTLFGELSEYDLSFVGFSNMDTTENVSSHTTTIVLAALCAVLAVLVFVFLLAFVVRTRTLNQRLEKLTKPKFGSQDSGLNRDGMVVPGTNLHALEGSNPVWNHETVIDNMFDRMSQSSGDSDLVGIEDNPHFNDKELGGISNPAYQAQLNVNPYVMVSAPPPYSEGPRRTSLNPLAAAAQADGFDSRSNAGSLATSLEDIDMPKRISLNPLFDADLDVGLDDVDEKPAPVNSNFSFQLPPGEQVTDL